MRLSKAKINLCLLALALLLTQCQPADPLIATWKIAGINYQPSARATPEDYERGQQIQAMRSGFQNSTFALYNGQRSAFFSTETPYRQGTWSLGNDRLTLQIGENAQFSFDIIELNDQQLTLTLADVGPTEGELTLVCMKSKQYIYGDIDLLAPEQNEWRLKPEKRQTDAEIKLRAKAHLKYLINYFECVKEKKQTYFETGLVSSPFAFYAHGLGLSKVSPSAKRWQAYFYDQRDANRAFEQLKKSVKKVDKYPKASTFTEEYLLAFKKMRPYFDE